MELYFNPYPGPAQSMEDGIQLVVNAADALFRLQKSLQKILLSGTFSNAEFDRPSNFVLIREAQSTFRIQDTFNKAKAGEREKIRLLLNVLSKGKVISLNDVECVEDWVIKSVGAPAPVLEIAAKNRAIALTIPTEPEWRVDRIEFDNRDDFLHNLWGQKDLSQLTAHCADSLTNPIERFSARYAAIFCDGALNSAPEHSLWDSFGFFQNMDKAKARGYHVDSDLIKNVADTKHGTLLELRCYGFGQRIFFVFRKNAMPAILIGGFYEKNGGTSQNTAINDAQERINQYVEG
ncbi:MAG: hypothetical protein FWC40_00460 [Proteobacteria bacterium]|nr:hypothetical protein [Pseudomonadota bacterium]